MKIAIGADHGGLRLKEEIKHYLIQNGHDVFDKGCHCPDSVDYPDYAIPVCEAVQTNEVERAILICGTGIGMSIAANKMKGIRCALLSDTFSARATRQHNDTNVMALGERVIGTGLALELVNIWLNTAYEGGRHAQRVNKMMQLEQSI